MIEQTSSLSDQSHPQKDQPDPYTIKPMLFTDYVAKLVDDSAVMAIDSLAKPVDTPVSPIEAISKLVCSLQPEPIEPASNNYGDHISRRTNKEIQNCTVYPPADFYTNCLPFQSLNYLATSSTRKKNSWPREKS
jgi:hypothetical protein